MFLKNNNNKKKILRLLDTDTQANHKIGVETTNNFERTNKHTTNKQSNQSICIVEKK